MDRNATSPRRSDRIWVIAIGLAVALGAAVRVWAALQWRMNFDSDEAIFALMARHILQGQFTPVVYGTEHLGSIESIISAGAMAIAGPSVPVFRSSAVALMIIFLILSAVYISRHWGLRVAFLATTFLALPGFHVLEWTFQPIGDYAVMLATGVAILLLAERLPQASPKRLGIILAIGLLAGLGLWSNQMEVVFLAAAFLPLGLRSEEWRIMRGKAAAVGRRLTKTPEAWVFGAATFLAGILVIAAFFVSGCEPSWRFAKVQWGAKLTLGAVVVLLTAIAFLVSKRKQERIGDGLVLTLGSLIGSAPLWASWLTSDLRPVNVIHRSCPTGVDSRLLLLLKQIFPALWGVPELALLRTQPVWVLTLWGLVIAFIALSIAWFLGSRWGVITRVWCWAPTLEGQAASLSVLVLFAGPIGLSVLGSNTVDIYSVRHLIIAWLASAIIFSLAIDRVLSVRWRLGVAIGCLWIGWLALAALSNANGHWRVKFTPYSTADVNQLVSTLAAQGVDSGYADYWGAYTVDYLSGERITIAPYNGIDRYRAYSEYVGGKDTIAFVFPTARAPKSGAGPRALADFLKLPNEFSGEGPAKSSIIQAVEVGTVRDFRTIGPWDVWIVSRSDN